MFDLSRALSVVTELFGRGGDEAAPNPLLDLLAERGLDPSALEGLGQDQIMSFLAEHGIDAAGLDPQQVLSFLQSYGLDGALDLSGGDGGSDRGTS